MSINKIGDYIHFRQKNYMTSGINVKGTSAPNTINVFKQHEATLTRMVHARKSPAAIKKKLEQQLNFFFNANTSSQELNTKFTPQEAQSMQNAIIKIFNETVAKLNPNIDLNKFILDYSTLSASYKNPNSTKVAGAAKQQIGQGKSGTTWNYAVIDRFDKLRGHYLTMLNSMTDAETLVERINDLEEQYSKLIDDLRSDDMIRKQFKRTPGTWQDNFVTELNSIFEEMRIHTAAHVEGLMGEYIPIITQYVLQHKTINATKEILDDFFTQTKQSFVGKNGSIQYIDPLQFIGGKKAFSKNEELFLGKADKVKMRTLATQDKVDILLDVPTGRGKKLKASVKNYQPKSSITLQKGNRSLLNFIQDYPIFANHYMNITVEHPEDQNSSVLDIAGAHRLMKLTIIVHALVGGSRTTTGRQDIAEILILNNNAKGKFEVYWMKDLVKKVMQNINLATISGYNNPTWNNDWVIHEGNSGLHDIDAGYARSALVLSQLHRTRITKVNLSTKALRK